MRSQRYGALSAAGKELYIQTDLTGGSYVCDVYISLNLKSGIPVKSHHPVPRSSGACGPSIGVPDSVP